MSRGIRPRTLTDYYDHEADLQEQNALWFGTDSQAQLDRIAAWADDAGVDL